MHKNMKALINNEVILTHGQAIKRFKELEYLIAKNAYLWGTEPSPKIRMLVDEFELMRTVTPEYRAAYETCYPYDGWSETTAYDLMA